MLKARDSVRTLKEYHPPLGNRQGLRLDFNENTSGCSPHVLERLRTITGDDLARYPQREPSERIVANALEVFPEEVLLTNGTDEAIHLICETYLEPGDEALIVVPTFAMFEIYAAATGAQVISIPSESGFKFPMDAVLARVTPRIRFIAIANPNNPTGGLVAISDLTALTEAAPDAALLIDEAYFQFCGETIAPRWREFPNLFVSRTFSKAYGMAGLRIGVLMGNTQQMPMLRRASSPYNLNSVALACLPEALGDEEYVQDYVSQTLEGRSQLEAELDAWAIRFWPSRANFVLLHMGEHCQRFVGEMRQRGILVRDRSADYGCLNCVRITVGRREHNEELLISMREVFVGLGLRQRVAR